MYSVKIVLRKSELLLKRSEQTYLVSMDPAVGLDKVDGYPQDSQLVQICQMKILHLSGKSVLS
jgi:hypothetical protein